MILSGIFKGSRLIAAAFFFLLIPLFCNANESYIFNDDKIVGEKAIIKINEMGTELFQTSNVSVYAFVSLSIGDVNKTEYWSNFTKELKEPYVLLIMLTNDRVVDILYSPELEGRFDKAKVLSPYPEVGSILPLLVLKKDYDNFTAAVLNGFADIVEQIAASYGITLKSAIGSSNRSTLAWIRFVVYGMFALAFLIYIYKKVQYRHAKKEK